MRILGSSIAIALLLTLVAWPAEADTARVTVDVKDDDGKPVEGADVLLWTEDELHELTTGADGTCRFEVPTGVYGGNVRLAGAWTQEKRPIDLREAGSYRLWWTMRPGVPLRGRVTDHDGRPIEGASVCVTPGGIYGGVSRMTAGPRVPFAREETDADGWYHVGGVPTATILTLRVRASGFRTTNVCTYAADTAPPEDELLVRLDAGVRATGRVVRASGEPIAREVVYVVPARHAILRTRPEATAHVDGEVVQALTTRTDDDGRYVVEGLTRGETYVAVTHIGDTSQLASSLEFAAGTASDVEAPDLVHYPGDLIVLLRDTQGAPVEAAEVTVRVGYKWLQLAPSGAPGAWRRSGLSVGRVPLTVKAPGYVERRGAAFVASGAISTEEIELVRAVVLAGRLVDDQAQPVAGATVSVLVALDDAYDHAPVSIRVSDRTDEQGRFALGGLPRGIYALEIEATGHIPTPHAPVSAPADDLLLTARRLGSVSFTLHDAGGTPWSGPFEVWRRVPGGSGWVWKQATAQIHAGRVTLPDVTTSHEPAEVRAKGRGALRLVLVAAPGNNNDIGVLTLGPPRALGGTLVDTDGQALGGARVSLGPTAVLADETGRFELPDLADGPCQVCVTTPSGDRSWHPMTIGADTSDVRIVVTQDPLRRVVVVDRGGRRLGKVMVTPHVRVDGVWYALGAALSSHRGELELRLPPYPVRWLGLRSDEGTLHVLAPAAGEPADAEPIKLVLRD